jgi:hypothetical protein
MRLRGPRESRLIVIRGNSASGKSTIASLIREKHGRGIAVIGQDNLRRVILRERDTAGAANIGLIGLTCRYALANGFHVVLEGILAAGRYGEMLAGLRAQFPGRSSWWFLDIGFSETLERHGTQRLPANRQTRALLRPPLAGTMAPRQAPHHRRQPANCGPPPKHCSSPTPASKGRLRSRQWLAARGVTTIVTFPVSIFGSGNAPERRAGQGILHPITGQP